MLRYDPETGHFTWIAKASKNTVIGSKAGREHKKRGYTEISVDKRLYYAHRLVWLYMHGEFPPNDIDHINGMKSDNRLCNLLPATRSENNQNQSAARKTYSGLLGVTWSKTANKWNAQIKIYGKHFSLGMYDTAMDAHVAYLICKEMIHKFSPEPRPALPSY